MSIAAKVDFFSRLSIYNYFVPIAIALIATPRPGLGNNIGPGILDSATHLKGSAWHGGGGGIPLTERRRRVTDALLEVGVSIAAFAELGCGSC